MGVASDLSERATGALLGVFVGDALGMPYEGQPGHLVPERVEMIDGRAPAGSYTDDTQMTMAVAESLLRCDGADEEDLAATIRSRYDPARGYGSGTRAVISLWDQGIPVPQAAAQIFDGMGARSNGAAMRAAPVGVLLHRDETRLVSEARRSATVTHSHPEGADGAVAVAVAVGGALAGRQPLDAAMRAVSTPAFRCRLEQLSTATADGLDPQELSGPNRVVSPLATDSVPVAILLGTEAESFEQAVTLAVRCGGDTDTVAAMAGAIAGARFGATSIPARWYRKLENRGRERDDIERFAVALAEAALKA